MSEHTATAVDYAVAEGIRERARAIVDKVDAVVGQTTAEASHCGDGARAERTFAALATLFGIGAAARFVADESLLLRRDRWERQSPESRASLAAAFGRDVATLEERLARELGALRANGTVEKS